MARALMSPEGSSCADAKVAFVTPSHKYPMGMPLRMARRRALVEWARERGGWTVEDAYDSELRYAGHPFPAMQGMDSSQGRLSRHLQ